MSVPRASETPCRLVGAGTYPGATGRAARTGRGRTLERAQRSALEGLRDRHADRQHPQDEVRGEDHPAAPEALSGRNGVRSMHRQRTEPSAAPPGAQPSRVPNPLAPEVEHRFRQGETDEWRCRQPQQEAPRQLGLAGSWYQPGWRRSARRTRTDSNGTHDAPPVTLAPRSNASAARSGPRGS